MSWPNFENLLKRGAREVEGLRAVRLYGVPGQAQDGIDVVGINLAGENEAVHGKAPGGKYGVERTGEVPSPVADQYSSYTTSIAGKRAGQPRARQWLWKPVASCLQAGRCLIAHASAVKLLAGSAGHR